MARVAAESKPRQQSMRLVELFVFTHGNRTRP